MFAWPKNTIPKLLILTTLLFLLSLVVHPIQSEDLFIYLSLAREFFNTGHFPVHDLFLYTIPDYPWTIMHQWLSYLLYYAAYVIGGFNLVIFFKAFLIGLIFYVPVRLAEKNQDYLVWSFSSLLALLAMSFRTAERTSLFSDFFIILVICILISESIKPGRWKYALPVIFLLWVNMHPGFVVGWVVLVAFLFIHSKKYKSWEYRKLLILSLISVPVVLLNPKGLEGLLYPFHFATNEGVVFRKFYFEWMPTLSPMFRYQIHNLYVLVLIFLNLFLLFRARKKAPYFELFISLLFICYGFYAIRFLPTMCFALMAINVALSLRQNENFKSGWGTKLLVVLLAGLTIKNVLWGHHTISGKRNFGVGFDGRVVPSRAAQLILESPQIGNIYNSHMFGAYLSWAWQGKRKIFYHGFVTDTDFFLNEYATFAQSPEKFKLQVKKYNIGAFLLDRFSGIESLVQILVSSQDWKLVYKDEGSLLFLPTQ